MSDQAENGIELPAPTAWPMVLACGVTLLGAGYLMHPMLAIVGVAAVLVGCAGWFRDVLPVEREEVVPVVEPAAGRAVPPRGTGAAGGNERASYAPAARGVPLLGGTQGGARRRRGHGDRGLHSSGC